MVSLISNKDNMTRNVKVTEMSQISKSIETERLVVAREWKEGETGSGW
jgi:hypothetical protein